MSQSLESNLKLVHKIANRYKVADDYDDLFQVGCIGLHKAIDRFDPSSGTPFGTYAAILIKGEIQHYLRDKTSLIKTSRDLKEKPKVTSLNAVLTDDGSVEFIDTIAAPTLTDDEAESVREVISGLEYPTKQAVTMVYLNGLLRQEAAEWLNVSPMSLGRYCQAAIEQIQKRLADASSQSQLRPTIKLTRQLVTEPHDALPYRDGTGLHIPEKLVCPYCDRIFGRWNPVKARCCSRSCSTKLGRQQGNRAADWSPQELNYLRSLIGTRPHVEVIATYLRTAQARKWPKRSKVAVEIMIQRTARTVRALQDNWSVTELAKQLGIDRDRARGWVRFNGLPYRKVSQRLGAIRREDLQNFCRQRPDLFTGIAFDRLLAVLQDEELAKTLAAQPARVKRRMVQRLDTKQVYPSERAMARALGTSKTQVRREVKRSDGWLKESGVILVGSGVQP